MDKILISGIRAFGYHGVLASERENGQDFYVDLELSLNLNAAGKSDDLKKSVDYDVISKKVKVIIAGSPVKLIETLAENIAEALLKDYRKVQKVRVTVHKPEAPMSVDFLDLAISIERKR